MLLLIEAGFSIYYHFQRKVDSRVMADCYTEAGWIKDYYQEFRESSSSQWRPYVYWRRKPYNGNYINVDENGLRKTSFESGNLKPDRKIRIFVFGGSAVWGTGVRDQFTIPSLIGFELTKKGIPVEIMNLGESGYVSTQEMIEFIHQLQNGNVPDMVIFYDGVNDIFSTYQQAEAGIPQNEYNRIREFNAAKEKRKTIGVLFESVKTLSMVRFVVEKVQMDAEPKNYTAPEIQKLADQAVEIYSGNLRVIASLGKEYGFKPLFYWQPVIFKKECLSEYEQNEAAKVSYIKEFTFAVDKQLMSFDTTQELILLYDISNIFSKTSEPVFIDFCHISEKGNSVIAARIADDIEQAFK